ncbi:MAG: hypothetical protein BHV88_07800 [Clostridiales bacterium 41_12_two_minus]|nr:MAG: hypothetical protein BHV88_07800 [Clostridiales bacterium 41_12_two_minus]
MAAIYSAVFKNKDDMSPDSVENARELVRMIREAQPIETAAEKIFSQDTVEEAYIDRLLSFARSSSDEYERGKVFHCLLDRKDRLSGITGGAKKRLTSYFEEELESTRIRTLLTRGRKPRMPRDISRVKRSGSCLQRHLNPGITALSIMRRRLCSTSAQRFRRSAYLRLPPTLSTRS